MAGTLLFDKNTLPRMAPTPNVVTTVDSSTPTEEDRQRK